MRHRIFVVRLRSDVGRGAAREHWEERHGSLFLGTPGLLGYVQNRPVEPGPSVCSETWFADREAERAAYADPRYVREVAPDEASFLDRDSAVAAVVTAVEGKAPPATARLLVLGSEAPEDAGVRRQAYRLDRPWPGGEAVVGVAWSDDVDLLTALASELPGTALVVRPAALRTVGHQPG